MKLRSALVAAGLIALPAAAMAQPVDGLYVGAGAGYNYMQSQTVKTDGAGGSLKSPRGFLGLANVGFGFGDGFRVEIEGDFRNDLQKNSIAHSTNLTYGGFVNGFFDFDIGAEYFYPYVGVGGGYELTHLRGGVIGGSSGAPAAQGIIGASFPIPDFPGLSATAEYRFMATIENEKFNGVKVGQQYNHAGLLGLRYAFGIEPAPAPAPITPTVTPAPVPPPARTYLVFFDWDKADLTAAARQIISKAAANAPKVKVTRIEVSGYADLSGTHAYNQKLSLRRAQNVAAELVKDGVPQNEIDIMAFGDSHPLVPTAPGVREPQNRRVEIVLK